MDVGEWLEPGQDVNYMSDIVMKGDPEVGTAFYYMNLNYMAPDGGDNLEKMRISSIIRNWQKRSKQLTAQYIWKTALWKEKQDSADMSVRLHMIYCQKRRKQKPLPELAKMIERNENHLNTGFLTTHELSRSLSQYGQNRKAYDLLLQEENPAWLFAVTKGCTTIPESWDCYDEGRKST